MPRGTVTVRIAVIWLAAACLTGRAAGVSMLIDNLDSPGEGFNDPILGASRLSKSLWMSK